MKSRNPTGTSVAAAPAPDPNRVLAIVIDGLASAAFAAGLSDALLTFRGLSVNIMLTLAMSMLYCTLAILLSRRWWIAPALAAASGLVLLAVFWRAGDLPDVADRLAGYFRWIALWLFANQPPPPSAIWLSMLRTIIILFMSCVCVFLVRKIKPLAFYAVLTFLVFAPLLAWFPKSLSALLMALSGLIIMMPRHFLRKIRAQRPQDSELPRAPLQTLAIPVAVICLLLAQWIVPDSTMVWRLPVLVNQMNDLGDLIQLTGADSRVKPVFSIADFGFMPATVRLGGPVVLSGKTLLHVSSEKYVLLKGRTCSVYDGESWRATIQPSFRLNSSLWEKLRDDTFDVDLPNGEAGRLFKSKYLVPLRLTIRTQTPFQTILFAAGRVRSVSLEGELDYPPYFSADGSLFLWESFPEKFTYVVETDYPDRTLEGFDQAAAMIGQDAASKSDRKFQAVCDEYLQLPDELPQSVRDAALEAAGTAVSPYQKALSLENYFKSGFTYSLSPGFSPEKADFVEWFLKTRTGYCVYFATAFTVMARTLGIPARYVEGFALKAHTDAAGSGFEFMASGETAHAWAELYFKGIGWLTFDPTVGYSPEQPGPSPTPAVSPTPGATPTPVIVIPTPPVQPPDSLPPSAWGWLAVPPLSALVLAFGFLLARFRHRRRFSRQVVRKWFPALSGQLDFYTSDILRQLECIRIVPDPGETPLMFARRAERYLRVDQMSLPDVLWPFFRWVYGAIGPSEDDVGRIARLHRHLEARLRENMSALSYSFKRILRPGNMAVRHLSSRL